MIALVCALSCSSKLLSGQVQQTRAASLQLSACTIDVVQGNCTSRSGNQTEALVRQLPELTAGRVEYPPLKPFQCVLVIDKPFLWHNNGSLWIDNIYLAVSRKNVMPEFSMVQYGSLKHHLDGVGGNSIYITNTTFVGEGRGDARAIHSGEKKASILVEGVLSTVACCPAAGLLLSRYS